MRDTIFQLFGDKFQKSSAIIPTRLGFMAEQTSKCGLDFDTLLNNHTIYPFLTTFASEKNIETVYQKLRNNEKGSFYADLGLFHYTAKPQYLRYCPLCYQEEMNNNGEAYWHRLHQTPGVMICEEHNVPLCESAIPYESNHGRNYITASTVIKNICRTNCFTAQGSDLFSKLTRSIMFIYAQNKKINKLFQFYDRNFTQLFLQLLEEKNYATPNRSIHKEKLLTGFQNFFGKEILDYLGYGVDKQMRPWLISLCHKGRITWDPIKYILMSIFLCGSFESFIDVADKKQNRLPQNRKLNYKQYVDSDKLELYHARWLVARKNALTDMRSSIIEQDRAAYTWLMRHDKQWLTENSPESQKRGGNVSLSNWGERDKLYSKRIPTISQQFLQIGTGKPVRVTKMKLCKQLGINSKVLSNGHLPGTEKIMREWMETQEEYRRRKIAWAVSQYKKENLPIVNWQILRKADIRDCDWQDYYSLVQKFSR